MSNSGPYSNRTLHAFIDMGRAMRVVCRSMDRLDCPAKVSRNVQRARARGFALSWQLTLDYMFSTRRAASSTPLGMQAVAIVIGAAIFGWLVGGSG